MSLSTDYFSDAELTSFAMEILKDLGTKPRIDRTGTNSFICELADEIEKEIIENDPTSPLYALLCSPSSIDSKSHSNERLPLSPQIVSRCQLSINDSFNQSFPALPYLSPSPKGKSVDSNRKLSPKARYRSPVSMRAESDSVIDRVVVSSPSNKCDISPCISLHNQQTVHNILSVPNFSTKSPSKQRKKERKISIANRRDRDAVSNDDIPYWKVVQKFRRYPYINYCSVLISGYFRRNVTMDKSSFVVYNDNFPAHLTASCLAYSFDARDAAFQLTYIMAKSLKKINKSHVKQDLLNLIMTRYLTKGPKRLPPNETELKFYWDEAIRLDFMVSVRSPSVSIAANRLVTEKNETQLFKVSDSATMMMSLN